MGRTPYTGPVFKLSAAGVPGCASAGTFGGSAPHLKCGPLSQARFRAQLDTSGIAPGEVFTEDTGMPTGTIARLLIDKGFGFIRDESGIEHFFHRSSVRGAVFELLREGQRVEFQVEDSANGPRAGDVRLIEG